MGDISFTDGAFSLASVGGLDGGGGGLITSFCAAFWYCWLLERGADQMTMAATMAMSAAAPMATPIHSQGTPTSEGGDGGKAGGGAGGSTFDVVMEATSMAAGAPNMAVVAAVSV